MEIQINNMNLNDLESICSNLEKDFDDFWNYNILKNELQNPNSIYFVAKDKNNNILGLIGLAMKAGKISFGADSVEEDCKKGKIHLLIIAQDASERTQKKFKEISENYNIELIIDSNIEQLSKTIGKSNKAILGIKDRNFAKSIQKKYNGGDIIG